MCANDSKRVRVSACVCVVNSGLFKEPGSLVQAGKVGVWPGGDSLVLPLHPQTGWNSALAPTSTHTTNTHNLNPTPPLLEPYPTQGLPRLLLPLLYNHMKHTYTHTHTPPILPQPWAQCQFPYSTQFEVSLG